MTENKGLAATDLAAKQADLQDINDLLGAFGHLAYPVLRKQYLALGYQSSVDRMTRLTSSGEFDPGRFAENPVEGLRDWLQGYFDDRKGDMPEIWSEGRTVYLMTKACQRCLTLEAEKLTPVQHEEVCYVYCRAWAEGYLELLSDLFPGLIIHYHNRDSRRRGPDHDCVEAFQVVTP